MPAAPRLIVGLGNPGAEYSETRHNAGFWFCERLARELAAGFAIESRFHGRVAQARSAGVWLLQPQTFMNRSGLSVGAFIRFHRIPPDEILVVHDELDLPPGDLRLKFGGGLGGHNGLKDMLKPPRREERELIDTALDHALLAWPLIAKGDWNAAMKQAHTKPQPPASPEKP